MELILNTKDDCFLCLKSILNLEKNKLCLRNICRFLQINTSAVLLQGVKKEKKRTNLSNLFQDTTYNFTVNLCNPCYHVAERLSSLIHDMEVAQLQVNYYSDVFKKIFKKADLISAATKKTDSVETCEARMIQNIRKIVKQKCSARNKKALATTKLPLVKLNRHTKTKERENITKRSAIPRNTDSVYFDDDDSGEISYSRHHSADSDSIEILDYPPSSTIGMPASQVNENRNAESRKFNNTNQTTFDPPPNAETESISTSKLTNDENTTMKIRIEQILKNILINDFRKLGTGPHADFHCTICEEIVPKFTKKLHLTTMHLEKLFLFAKHAHVPEQVFHKLCRHAVRKEYEGCAMLPPCNNATSARYNCYICKETFWPILNIRHHFVMCRTNIITEKLHSFQQDEKIWMSFMNSADTDSALGPAKTLQRVGSSVVSSTVTGVDKDGRLHSELASKRLTTNVMMGDRRATSSIFHQEEQDDRKKRKVDHYQKEQVVTRRFACFQCKQSFLQYDKAQFHMISSHPEKIFKAFKPIQQNPFDFADSCRNLFEKETKEYTDGKDGQCAYCTNSYRYKADHLCHLVYSHTKILTEKIKTQNNKDKNASYPVLERKELVSIHGTAEESQEGLVDPVAGDRDNWYDLEDMPAESEDCIESDEKKFPILV